MRRFVRRYALALVASLLAPVGCADVGVPTGAEVPPLADAAPLFSASESGPNLAPLARFQRQPSVDIAWAKQWIGPEGGRLELVGFAIEVPAGAVDRVTQFSIRLPVDPSGAERVMAEFGPHGATFAQPVAIELPYAGTTTFGKPPTIAWWNPNRSAWEPFRTTVTADGQRIRTTTSHFSTYGSMDEPTTVYPTMSGG